MAISCLVQSWQPDSDPGRVGRCSRADGCISGAISGHHTIGKLIQLHLRGWAVQDCEEPRISGGEGLPSATWLELCRTTESHGKHERAFAQYERLANACPSERPALLAAGRLSLKNLSRPADALRFYETVKFTTAAFRLGIEYPQRNRTVEESPRTAPSTTLNSRGRDTSHCSLED
jgi:hypothetical protein